MRGRRSSAPLLAGAILACATQREVEPASERAAEVPVTPAPGAPAPTPAKVEAPPASLSPTTAPVRYAVDIRKQLHATHAMNWVREDTRSSFVLTLSPDGGATGCRGQRVNYSNDGPKVHTGHNTREQQGYRGRWQMDGEWIAINLSLDNAQCGQQRVYTNLEPQPWRLRCRRLTAQEHAIAADSPVLACMLANRREHTFDEQYGYFVPEVLADTWLILGQGDGLHILWESDSVPPGENPPKITITRAQAPIERDTWTRP